MGTEVLGMGQARWPPALLMTAKEPDRCQCRTVHGVVRSLLQGAGAAPCPRLGMETRSLGPFTPSQG